LAASISPEEAANKVQWRLAMPELASCLLWLALLIGFIGWFWLVAAAFDLGWPWGMAVLFFPPSALLFVARHYATAWRPFVVLVLGGLSFTTSIGLEYHEAKLIDAIRLDTNRPSANGYLALSDLEKFRLGRSQSDVLKDVKWRGTFFMACGHKGKTVCAVYYLVSLDGTRGDRGEGVWAIFVDDMFVKFVPWQAREMVAVPYEGGTWSRPKPTKVDDCSWLIRQLDRKPVSVADLAKEVKAIAEVPTDKHISLTGLAIAWVMLRNGMHNYVPSAEDYKRNAALRDQFNAARLRIGMTKSEVESMLEAKPLESGKVDAGSYHIYGSNESFKMTQLHFANVLVLFRDGKVSVIHRAPAGDAWRQELAWEFVDLPRRPAAAR
jgi:hypothetical protein